MSTFNLLLSGGLIGLLLSSAFMMLVVYRLSPMLQSCRQRSLRDQHIEPVLCFGVYVGAVVAVVASV